MVIICDSRVAIGVRGCRKIDSVPLNFHWTLRGGMGSRELTVDVKEKRDKK